MKINPGSEKGQVNGYDLNSAFKWSVIAGVLTAAIPILEGSVSGWKAVLMSLAAGAVTGALRFIQRWRSDNSSERH